MANKTSLNNPYGDAKVIDACSIFGMMDRSGRCFSGHDTITAIANMHDRGNGLGGGFAVYGCYPEFPDWYALHVMFMEYDVREDVEGYLRSHFQLHLAEPIPTHHTAGAGEPPQLWRYFVSPEDFVAAGQSADDYVVQQVMRVNTRFQGTFIFSSGKNMGVFKGIGDAEKEVGEGDGAPGGFGQHGDGKREGAAGEAKEEVEVGHRVRDPDPGFPLAGGARGRAEMEFLPKASPSGNRGTQGARGRVGEAGRVNAPIRPV